MHEVKVNRNQLLDTVKTNRLNHRAQFEDAISAWQRAVIDKLEKAVAAAKAGREYRTSFNLPMPQDHTDDYDDVIGMLEWHVDEDVELDLREYRRFVTDDWDWKDQFTATSTSYIAEYGR